MVATTRSSALAGRWFTRCACRPPFIQGEYSRRKGAGRRRPSGRMRRDHSPENGPPRVGRPPAPTAIARQLSDRISSSQLVVLPEVGHLMSIEAPETFNAGSDKSTWA